MDSTAQMPATNAGFGVSDELPSPAIDWPKLTLMEAFRLQQSDEQQGLSQSEAAARLVKIGPNLLIQAQRRSTFEILLVQFRSLIVALLVAATVIAFVMGDNLEAMAILVVIFINATIGFLTEWKAAQALFALQKQSVPHAHVIRDGRESEIPAAELVPGDLIILAAGARVPADGRIVESVRIRIDEAALTGESNSVSKVCEPLDEDNPALGDRTNMAFLGTTITDGRGRLLVTATGMATEVGKIGVLIDEATTRATPLEKKLAGLGRMLTLITLVLCSIIVVAGWLRGVTNFWPMFEIGLSLAIAAVPEGLPAVATMTLALGMRRMARQRALVRRLPAVETLGSTTIICTDKTGTLTKNEMTACVFWLDQRRIDVTGTGYSPIGIFQHDGASVDPQADEHLASALRIGLLCNDAKVERQNGSEIVLGDPTEAALIVAAEKAFMNRETLAGEYPRISEIPFDSATKRMVTVHRTPHDETVAFVKGAPSTMIETSSAHRGANGITPLTPDDRERWKKTNEQLAGAALRVLGLAYRVLPSSYDESDFSRDLVFVGLVGMSDPLREEARAAIATCREAGIRTVMITGDQKITAAEIARQVGIDVDQSGQALRTVHGRELANLDPAGWQRTVADTAVFARVSPAHKLQIVAALQQQGHVVAMTGDGVNDAPALKQADIGIAMGIKGTEVAKENADMVITDDNFATIVSAVEQGRIIYGNILRFIHYLLSCNFSEILTVFFALMIGWPLPLAALQILWLNLITDIFPAFALALEPSAPDVMKRAPRDPQKSLLPWPFVVLIIWQGLLLAAVTLLAFGLGLSWHGTEGEGLQRATTMAFMTLALAQIFHAFNARSQMKSALTSRLFANRWLWGAVGVCLLLQIAAVSTPLLQKVLRTVPPTISEWGVIATCSLAPMVVIEFVKLIQRWAVKRQSHVERIMPEQVRT